MVDKGSWVGIREARLSERSDYDKKGIVPCAQSS